MRGQIGGRLGGRVMQIKLNLDDNIDADLILELQDRADGGALSKALYLVIYEWFFTRAGNSPIKAKFVPEQTPDSLDAGPDDLSEAIAKIDEDW